MTLELKNDLNDLISILENKILKNDERGKIERKKES